MGRVKDMCMDMEERWHGIAIDIINDCEHIEEYRMRMTQHHDLVKHFSNDEINEIVNSVWNDYWEENRP